MTIPTAQEYFKQEPNKVLVAWFSSQYLDFRAKVIAAIKRPAVICSTSAQIVTEIQSESIAHDMCREFFLEQGFEFCPRPGDGPTGFNLWFRPLAEGVKEGQLAHQWFTAIKQRQNDEQAIKAEHNAKKVKMLLGVFDDALGPGSQYSLSRGRYFITVNTMKSNWSDEVVKEVAALMAKDGWAVERHPTYRSSFVLRSARDDSKEERQQYAKKWKATIDNA